jgi:hypothetical protein
MSEDNIYKKENIEQQIENDEIDPQEAGFMEGYVDQDLIKCSKCGKKLREKGIDLENCHEKEDSEGNLVLICDCCD